MNVTNTLKLLGVTLLAIGNLACDDDSVKTTNVSDGGGTENVVAEKTGYFIDSPVSGIKYTTTSGSDITDSEGGFVYKSGELVTFSIGGIQFPAVEAQEFVTPLDIAGYDELLALNITRFLLSLDSTFEDRDEITIASATHEALEAVTEFDFNNDNFDAEVDALLSLVNGIEGGLVDSTLAQSHLSLSLSEINEPHLIGDFTQDWLAGRTLYQVWFGVEENGESERSIIFKCQFAVDNSVTMFGILGVAEGPWSGQYQVNNGKLTIGVDGEAGEPGGEYYLKHSMNENYLTVGYYIAGEVDNIDYFVHDEQFAMQLARELAEKASER